MNKLGEFVLNKRKNLALTQVEYADRIGITAVTLSKIENGEEIGSNVLRKLSTFLNISPKVLREMMLYIYEDNE
jgi:transcriptional regulator with XRE-family HTH domain